MPGEVMGGEVIRHANGWRTITLKDAGTWLSGGTPSTGNDAYWNGDIPWISGASMKNFRITDSDRKVTGLGARQGSRLVDKGAVLFVVRGMSLKSEFRVGVTETQVAFGQDCKAIVPANGIDATYLGLAVQALTDTILTLVEETSHGTGRLDTGRLQQLRVPVPTLDEQHGIVAAHAAFDRRIGALERVLAKLSISEQALSAKALEPRPHWKRATIDAIADVAAGVTLGAEPVGEGTLELPYLRVANVLDGRIDTGDLKTVRILSTQLERYALRRGDLLLTEGGDLDKLGRGAVWDGRVDPCLHQNHVFRVRCGSSMDPDFLALYTGSVEGRAYFQRVGKQTTNLASINSAQVKGMLVPVPPIEEQRRNLEPIRAVRSRSRALERQIAKLRTIQQAVVEDLLAARVTAGPA